MKTGHAIALGIGAGAVAIGGAAFAFLRGKKKTPPPTTTAAAAQPLFTNSLPGGTTSAQQSPNIGAQLGNAAGNALGGLVNQGLSQLATLAGAGLNNLPGILGGLHF